MVCLLCVVYASVFALSVLALSIFLSPLGSKSLCCPSHSFPLSPAQLCPGLVVANAKMQSLVPWLLHPSLPLNNVARIRGQNPETLLGLIRDVGGRAEEGKRAFVPRSSTFGFSVDASNSETFLQMQKTSDKSSERIGPKEEISKTLCKLQHKVGKRTTQVARKCG
ncbi:hypothetical protein KCU91_g77, partial [Aureobasidium melanogenum]